MNVLYFTTFVKPSDFQLLVEKAAIKPNPAGQNFHSRLIHALLTRASIHIYSLIPNAEDILEEKTFSPKENVTITYFRNRSNRLAKLSLASHIARSIKGPLNPTSDIILYDSLNLTLAEASAKVAKKHGLQRVAILTDDPNNISGTSSFYRKRAVKLSENANAYFALTQGLLDVFNKGNKPSLIKMGIVEPGASFENPHPRPYLYYGGTLAVKDGTKALVEAYLEANPDYDLVLAGHGPYAIHLQQFDPAKTRIHFLGQISKEENLAYQQHADLLINPRLYSSSLDAVSVPSKVLEYLASKSNVLTTKSTSIFDEFIEDINVLPCEEREIGPDLKGFFRDHLDENKKLVGLKPNQSFDRLLAHYGVEAVGAALAEFLISLGVR